MKFNKCKDAIDKVSADTQMKHAAWQINEKNKNKELKWTFGLGEAPKSCRHVFIVYLFILVEK